LIILACLNIIFLFKNQLDIKYY